MKNIVEMIETLNDCIKSIDATEEYSMQYSEAVKATRKELQSFLPQPNEVPPEYLEIDKINHLIKLMEQPLERGNLATTLPLAEMLQTLINQCEMSDFSPELQRKLFGEMAESI